jgi:hypothetical protein
MAIAPAVIWFALLVRDKMEGKVDGCKNGEIGEDEDSSDGYLEFLEDED